MALATPVVRNEPPSSTFSNLRGDEEFGNEGGGPAFETLDGEMPVPEESDLIPDPLDDDPLLERGEMPGLDDQGVSQRDNQGTGPPFDPTTDPSTDIDHEPKNDPLPDSNPDDSNPGPEKLGNEEEETLGNEEQPSDDRKTDSTGDTQLDDDIVPPPTPKWESSNAGSGGASPDKPSNPWKPSSADPYNPSPNPAPPKPDKGNGSPNKSPSSNMNSSSGGPSSAGSSGDAPSDAAAGDWPANSNQKAADKAGNAVNGHIQSGVLDNQINGAGSLLDKFDQVNKIDQIGKGLDKANQIQAEIELLQKRHEFIDTTINEIKKQQREGTSTPELDRQKSELERARQANRIELLQKITTQAYESLKAATE